MAPSPRWRGEGWGEGQKQTPHVEHVAAPHPDPLPMKNGEREKRAIHHCAEISGAALIPAGVRACNHGVSLPATGPGWAHSPSHVAASGAWKESEWLEVQEARGRPSARTVSN